MIARGRAVRGERCKILVRSRISAIRFIEGGAPKFDAVNVNHQIDIDGIRASMPFVKNILRV